MIYRCSEGSTFNLLLSPVLHGDINIAPKWALPAAITTFTAAKT
jgi:hypothetical protein